MHAPTDAIDHRYSRGLTAGFVATVVLSAIMVAKGMMGVMPGLDVVGMLTKMVGASDRVVGWVIHVVIGVVLWGLLFGAIGPRLPGPMWWRGVLFATGAWLAMMIGVMPLAGAGFFGMNLGIAAPIATLILHVIYGAVLGWTFARVGFNARSSQPVKDPTLHP